MVLRHKVVAVVRVVATVAQAVATAIKKVLQCHHATQQVGFAISGMVG